MIDLPSVQLAHSRYGAAFTVTPRGPHLGLFDAAAPHPSSPPPDSLAKAGLTPPGFDGHALSFDASDVSLGDPVSACPWLASAAAAAPRAVEGGTTVPQWVWPRGMRTF